jgi:hypothetical protein
MDDRTSAVRFAADQVRDKQRDLDRIKTRETKRAESRKLQEEMKTAARALESTATSGASDAITQPRAAELLLLAVDAMEERDDYHSLADEYDDARNWLRRCGYEWASAVEGKPTLLDMMKNMLDHREGIHSHLHGALTYLGVPEKWVDKVRGGDMDGFFAVFYEDVVKEATPASDSETTGECGVDDDDDGEWLAEQALNDLRGSMVEVRDKLAGLLKLNGEVKWDDIVTKVDQLVAHQASVNVALNIVRGQIVKADKTLRRALRLPAEFDAEYVTDLAEMAEAIEVKVSELEKQLQDDAAQHVVELKELGADVERYRQGDETAAAEWKGHYLDIAMSVGVPRIVWADARNPAVDAVSNFIGQVMPLYKLVARVDLLAERVEALEPEQPVGDGVEGLAVTEMPEGAGPVFLNSPKIQCKCGASYPAGVIFCPECGETSKE